MSAADCKPNKSLRTTIKVFLRTEEKKRETARNKEAQESVLATPVVDVPPTPVEAPAAAETKAEAPGPAETPVVEETPLPATTPGPEDDIKDASGDGQVDTAKEEQDVPHATIEVRCSINSVVYHNNLFLRRSQPIRNLSKLKVMAMV